MSRFENLTAPTWQLLLESQRPDRKVSKPVVCELCTTIEFYAKEEDAKPNRQKHKNGKCAQVNWATTMDHAKMRYTIEKSRATAADSLAQYFVQNFRLRPGGGDFVKVPCESCDLVFVCEKQYEKNLKEFHVQAGHRENLKSSPPIAKVWPCDILWRQSFEFGPLDKHDKLCTYICGFCEKHLRYTNQKQITGIANHITGFCVRPCAMQLYIEPNFNQVLSTTLDSVDEKERYRNELVNATLFFCVQQINDLALKDPAIKNHIDCLLTRSFIQQCLTLAKRVRISTFPFKLYNTEVEELAMAALKKYPDVKTADWSQGLASTPPSANKKRLRTSPETVSVTKRVLNITPTQGNNDHTDATKDEVNNEDSEVSDDVDIITDAEDQTDNNDPTWRTVTPSPRKGKKPRNSPVKKKTTTTRRNRGITLSGRYDLLSQTEDDTDTQTENGNRRNPKQPPRPPPIVVDGQLTRELHLTIQSLKKSGSPDIECKHLNNNFIISNATPEARLEVMEVLKKGNIPFYTYVPRSDLPKHFVAKGVPTFLSDAEMTEEIKACGIDIIKSSRIVSKKESMKNITLKLFKVTTAKDVTLKQLKENCYNIYGSKITWEKFRSTGKPAICSNCLGHGHISVGCNRTPRCATCGRDHKTETCLETPEKPKCFNCGEEHSTFYKGCENYKKYAETRKPKPPRKSLQAKTVQKPVQKFKDADIPAVNAWTQRQNQAPQRPLRRKGLEFPPLPGTSEVSTRNSKANAKSTPREIAKSIQDLMSTLTELIPPDLKVPPHIFATATANFLRDINSGVLQRQLQATVNFLNEISNDE